jgi:hypothetical protein
MYVVRKRTFRDDLSGHKYDHLIVCERTNVPLFAMNARQVHGLYLVSEWKELTIGNFETHDLVHADHMLVPKTRALEDEGRWMFSVSDFAWCLKGLRDQWYPEWHLFVFADYFLTHHRMRWASAMMFDLGECLAHEEPLATCDGVVRSAFLGRITGEEDAVVAYTDLVSGREVHAFRMFDRRQIQFQAVFFGSLVNDLARRVVDATPVEFRKPITLSVVHGPTNTTWATVSNNPFQIPPQPRLAEMMVTMVVLNDEDHGREKRTSHVRYVTGIGAHHLDLNEPVVGVFEPDDCVYFECDMPWVGVCVRYVGYRVVPLARDDAFACEVTKVMCPNNDDIPLQIRRFFLGLKRIQRRWLRCVSDPAFLVCRRRLLREWEELI